MSKFACLRVEQISTVAVAVVLSRGVSEVPCGTQGHAQFRLHVSVIVGLLDLSR